MYASITSHGISALGWARTKSRLKSAKIRFGDAQLGRWAVPKVIVVGDFSDGFGAFRGKSQAREEPAGAHRPPLKSPEGKAFSILGLDPSASLSELKARYKELVKTHHPDRNGGDKLAEERLKDINDAYSTLRKCVTA